MSRFISAADYQVFLPDIEYILLDSQPSPMGALEAKQLIKDFLEQKTYYDRRGAYTWVLIEHCSKEGIQYSVTGSSRRGFAITVC